MRSYELGQLKIDKHDVEKLTEALGIPNERFEYIVNLARDAWDHEDTISESIEYLAQRAEDSRDVNGGDPISGSELVLAYVFFGRIWEDNQQEDE